MAARRFNAPSNQAKREEENKYGSILFINEKKRLKNIKDGKPLIIWTGLSSQCHPQHQSLNRLKIIQPASEGLISRGKEKEDETETAYKY